MRQAMDALKAEKIPSVGWSRFTWRVACRKETVMYGYTTQDEKE
jgi:hypothetical protein